MFLQKTQHFLHFCFHSLHLKRLRSKTSPGFNPNVSPHLTWEVWNEPGRGGVRVGSGRAGLLFVRTQRPAALPVLDSEERMAAAPPRSGDETETRRKGEAAPGRDEEFWFCLRRGAEGVFVYHVREKPNGQRRERREFLGKREGVGFFITAVNTREGGGFLLKHSCSDVTPCKAAAAEGSSSNSCSLTPHVKTKINCTL